MFFVVARNHESDVFGKLVSDGTNLALNVDAGIMGSIIIVSIILLITYRPNPSTTWFTFSEM